MASLIETLIDVLDKENTEYTKLLDLSNEKTSAIVNGDVDKLQSILVREQERIDAINALDEQREISVKDICDVLGLPVKDVKVADIARMLEKQPREHDALESVDSKLKQTLNQLMRINENNKVLLKESMDMIEFELNLAKNTVTAPQTANYGKGAYEDNTITGKGMFDAKQ